MTDSVLPAGFFKPVFRHSDRCKVLELQQLLNSSNNPGILYVNRKTREIHIISSHRLLFFIKLRAWLDTSNTIIYHALAQNLSFNEAHRLLQLLKHELEGGPEGLHER